MNNSFSIAIWYFIKFVLFMFLQGSYLVAFGITHLPTAKKYVKHFKEMCLSQTNKSGLQPPFLEWGTLQSQSQLLTEQVPTARSP